MNPETSPALFPAPRLKFYAWLSIGAALATIALKGGAWVLTGSVGLLSDAMESGVNLAGALMMLWMLHIAAQPADEQHAYGHSKAEYFASGFEGILIIVTALGIGWVALERLFTPQALTALDVGLALSLIATALNFVIARVLFSAGKQHQSIALEADAQHLMTDVWTSAGIIAGIAAVGMTGYLWLDPLLALLVSANIIWTGVRLIQHSASGLMDSVLPPEQQEEIEAALRPYREEGIEFHALMTRQAGMRIFISMHVLTPGHWTVLKGHNLVEKIEADIRQRLPRAHIITHLEPIEDPASLEDSGLDRSL